MKQPQILRVRRGSEKQAVRHAAEVLQRGLLVIIPTDTVYGIAADPRVPGAEERLYEVKGRDKSKPIPLLAASIAEVEKYGAIFGELEKKLVEKFWPGPLTLVLQVTKGVQHSAFSIQHSNEGFRVPDCELALALLRKVGGILRVTSANRSGEPPALTVKEAMHSLGSFVEVALDAGTVPGGMPSTVVKVIQGSGFRVQGSGFTSRKAEIRILREGAVAKDALSGVREAPTLRRGKEEEI